MPLAEYSFRFADYSFFDSMNAKWPGCSERLRETLARAARTPHLPPGWLVNMT
jgi:hypothetical protein